MSAPQPSDTPLLGPLERAPVPDLATDLIPKERYTSRDWAALEREKLWPRVWLLAGRASDIPEPGDYFTFEIGEESIVVVRQPDASIAACVNVCMHRGNRLVPAGRGHAKRFSCPFHGWCYASDGTLLEALDPQTFPQGVPKDRLSLPKVHSGTWAGFVWVRLSDEGESLEDFLGVLTEQFAPYHFEEWAIDFEVTVEVACNWKTSVDAFNEAYHVSVTHPQALPIADDFNCPIDCYDKHTRMVFSEATASPRHADYGGVTQELKDHFLTRLGVDLDAVGNDPVAARQAAADAMRQASEALGGDTSGLSDDQMIDDFHYTVFPNITFNIHSLFTWVFRHRPHPDDPNKMYFDYTNLVRRPKQDVPRPERLEYVQTDDFKLAQVCPEAGIGAVIDQDLSNMKTVQAGMRSSHFPGLHLSSQEIRIRHFHETLKRYVEG